MCVEYWENDCGKRQSFHYHDVWLMSQLFAITLLFVGLLPYKQRMTLQSYCK